MTESGTWRNGRKDEAKEQKTRNDRKRDAKPWEAIPYKHRQPTATLEGDGDTGNGAGVYPQQPLLGIYSTTPSTTNTDVTHGSQSVTYTTLQP